MSASTAKSRSARIPLPSPPAPRATKSTWSTPARRTGQGSVSVINAENNSVAATIPVHKQPVAIALDPDGDLAYVANSGSNSISVLDLKARREVAQIGTGEDPAAARVAPDGKTLVVANRGGNSVSIIDTATRTVRAVFEGCPGASDVVILPDSSKAFAACSGGHQVMAIQLAHEARPDGRPATTDRLESLLDVGRAPVQLALKPDGGEIFVSNSLSNSISEVYANTDDVAGAYLMGADPVRGLVSADNSLLYVGNLHSQEVTVYSIDDGKRVASIHVGDGPSALAFSAAGHLLFVVDARSGDVAVVRTATSSDVHHAPRRPRAQCHRGEGIQGLVADAELATAGTLPMTSKTLPSLLRHLLHRWNRAELCAGKEDQSRDIGPEQQAHGNIKRSVERLQVQMRQHSDEAFLRNQPDDSRDDGGANDMPAQESSGWAAASRSRRKTGWTPRRWSPRATGS